MTIPVAEIFGPTIQGEGPNVGIKTLFVRVVGCDFKCEWCDSKFAWKFNSTMIKYKDTDLAKELVSRCKRTHTKHVILTGGNPCLYDFGQIIDILHRANITVDVETQGSTIPYWLCKVDTIVFSPKAPSSKQRDVLSELRNWLLLLDTSKYQPKVAIKIPVFDEADFEFAKMYYNEIIVKCGKDIKLDMKMYLSVGNTDTEEKGNISNRVLMDYKKLIDKVMKSELEKIYILPQVHTLVWGNKQGV